MGSPKHSESALSQRGGPRPLVPPLTRTGRGARRWGPPLALALILAFFLSSALAQAAPQAPVPVTFVYLPPAGEHPSTVSLRGDFNNWGETPLVKQPDGSFSATVLLTPGRHQYKFFIDGRWPRDMATGREGGPVDPKADGYVDDGFGGKNAYREVAASSEVALGTGRIYAPGLSFRPSDPAYVIDAGQPGNRGAGASEAGVETTVVRLRTAPNNVEAVGLIWRPASGGLWHSAPMRRIGVTLDAWVFQGIVPSGSAFEIRFALENGGPARYYGERGLTDDPAQATPFRVDLPVSGPALLTWATGTVGYQIFPDRFRDGDPGNDPPNVTPWGGPIGPDTSTQYYGGDLKGIIEELPYLHRLGVGLIYLNPIFEAQSSHRYDTVDYMKIDPMLGTLADFRELLRRAHALGIKVILDGVFNHTGTRFWAFRDVISEGEKSPYVNWYFIKGFPVSVAEGNYEGWDGLASLPKLNVANPAVTSYLLSVVRYWTEQGIDGWRFDVPNEIQAPGFWSAVRKTVKEINPNAYLVGEIWVVDPAWLQGDRFDALMNYPIGYKALLPFFSRAQGWSASRLAESVESALLAYSPAVDEMSFNLLDSHDTPRALTLLGGGDLGATPSELAIRRMEAAIAVQFTLPGIPVVYYGDERGMLGDRRDHWDAQRATVDWGRAEVPALLSRYEALIRIRHDHPALWSAGVTSLLIDDAKGVWVYERRAKGEVILVATTNAAGPAEVTLPSMGDGLHFRDLLSGQTVAAGSGGLTIDLDGPQTRLFLEE